ncbi:hypothetical protein [Streptomyces sp. 840.1]|uniref:hypothetical protein n=1 Tax=Streptomyces sp. 840.1 TaxID=2485152 RepID=UPI0021A2B8D5|nr:hypothetical protein [Streptomyces sp. 840.1]
MPEARVRPDYAVETSGRITGFLKLEVPGHDVTLDGYTKRDREQWELMRTAVARCQSGSCGHNSGAQVRRDEGSCGGSGFSSVASAASKAGTQPGPCSASSKLSNLAFGAGDAV